jgi:hypothetical protein
MYIDKKFKREIPKIDFDTDIVVSYSQFSLYNKCPKKWELSYIQKKKFSKQSIHLVYGTAIHNTIQSFLIELYSKTAKLAEQMDLNKMFLEDIKRLYKKEVDKSGVHFSTKEELGTFYADGCQVLDYFKKKRSLYFSNRKSTLIGIELPIHVEPDDFKSNLKLQSYLDVVIYDKQSKKYEIIDIKTSTRGWNDYDKKDKIKTGQLVLYKKYFCDKYNIDPKLVDINYFILRQKVDPNSLWPVKRIQEYAPSHGSKSLKDIHESFQSFLNDCFTKDGKYNKNVEYKAIKGERGFNCRYCEYDNKPELCPIDKRI